jgi:hypothetical protein
MKIRKPLVRVATVDPGFNGTGCALFKTLSPGVISYPDDTSLIKPIAEIRARPKSNPNYYEELVINIAGQFSLLLTQWDVRHVAIETPKLFGSSAVSHASAAGGDLFRLTYLVGWLACRGYNYTVEPTILFTANEWKGEMGKEAVDRRICRAYERTYTKGGMFKNHVSDAVGMGLALVGKL